MRLANSSPRPQPNQNPSCHSAPAKHVGKQQPSAATKRQFINCVICFQNACQKNKMFGRSNTLPRFGVLTLKRGHPRIAEILKPASGPPAPRRRAASHATVLCQEAVETNGCFEIGKDSRPLYSSSREANKM